MIVKTPKPPYFAVIFTSIRTEAAENYAEMSNKLQELAKQQAGFLGEESVRENLGVSVSYWETLEAIQIWKNNAAHLVAQEKGKNVWYEKYKVRICKVERDYGFEK